MTDFADLETDWSLLQQPAAELPSNPAPPVIGGVLEDETVAYVHALYDALSSDGIDPALNLRLRPWSTEILALLHDLAPGQEDRIYSALLEGQDIGEREALRTAVGQVLNDNIDLIRASG